MNEKRKLTRRAFTAGTALVLAGTVLDGSPQRRLMADDEKHRSRVCFGLITDLHYADRDPAGSRYYRQTLAKLDKACEQFERDRPDFVVELGDFIDAADTVEGERAYLARVNEHFTKLPGRHYYVLGNHCVYTLTKDEFLDEVGLKKSYYSFDMGGLHFIVLDACFRSDGQPYGRNNFQWTDSNVPANELDWLRADLKRTDKPTIVFIHQRLDVGQPYGVKNAADVRKVLEAPKRVLAVFQGHYHKNAHKEIAGIHYCTIAAMVEGSGEQQNAFATVDVFEDNSIRVTGYDKQESYRWE